MRKLTLVFFLMLTIAPVVSPQEPAKPTISITQDISLSEWNKLAYRQLKDWLQKSAEKMPEQDYDFKPNETARQYGEIVGHLADIQYRFCSIVRGDNNGGPSIEKTKTTKADLIIALKEAFAYCDPAYDGMTDASANDMVKLAQNQTPKISVLSMNIAHLSLHYGSLVSYMRMKNIVPPSTEEIVRAPEK